MVEVAVADDPLEGVVDARAEDLECDQIAAFVRRKVLAVDGSARSKSR